MDIKVGLYKAKIINNLLYSDVLLKIIRMKNCALMFNETCRRDKFRNSRKNDPCCNYCCFCEADIIFKNDEVGINKGSN